MTTRSTAVRVADLPDMIGTPLQVPRPLLLCPTCGEQFSAERGDYWDANPGTVFRHCRRNMQLVTVRTVFTEVTR